MTIDANTLVKSPSVAVLKWYGIHQNNSGGSYVINDDVAEWVFVQAASVEDAVRRLDDITEVSSYDWCECCGARWSTSWLDENDGHPEPMVYDKPLLACAEGYWKGQQARLYAHDGRKAAYTIPRSGG